MSKRMIDSELIEALGTDIRFDGTGNVIVGKNLEVNGTTKLNGGLEILRTYKFNDNISTKLEVLFERHNNFSSTWDEYIGYGYISQFGTRHPCIFSYTTNNGAIETLYATSDTSIYTLENKQVVRYDIAKKSECQPKLYRHVITLHANSTADGVCRLEWISSNNLVCDSLEDLRTVLGNPQMQSYIASNPSGDVFGVVISPSTAQIKKVGTTSLLNITSVSDTVTAL